MRGGGSCRAMRPAPGRDVVGPTKKRSRTSDPDLRSTGLILFFEEAQGHAADTASGGVVSRRGEVDEGESPGSLVTRRLDLQRLRRASKRLRVILRRRSPAGRRGVDRRRFPGSPGRRGGFVSNRRRLSVRRGRFEVRRRRRRRGDVGSRSRRRRRFDRSRRWPMSGRRGFSANGDRRDSKGCRRREKSRRRREDRGRGEGVRCSGGLPRPLRPPRLALAFTSGFACSTHLRHLVVHLDVVGVRRRAGFGRRRSAAPI